MSDALAAVVRHRPAVVCFTNLLGYSGHLTSFIDNLPAGATKKRAPVIILTAYPLNDVKLAEMVPGFIPGYDAYFQKPAVIADVLDCVRRSLRIA
jgi:DNA-binding response OmpR family regulator